MATPPLPTLSQIATAHFESLQAERVRLAGPFASLFLALPWIRRRDRLHDAAIAAFEARSILQSDILLLCGSVGDVCYASSFEAVDSAIAKFRLEAFPEPRTRAARMLADACAFVFGIEPLAPPPPGPPEPPAAPISVDAAIELLEIDEAARRLVLEAIALPPNPIKSPFTVDENICSMISDSLNCLLDAGLLPWPGQRSLATSENRQLLEWIPQPPPRPDGRPSRL